jgi:DHA2 family multidrug resistance protein
MMVGARLSSVIGPRPTMVIGILAAAVSLWMMGDFSVDTQPAEVVLTGVIQGFGSPLTFMPLTMVGFATLPDRARTEAGSLHTLLRNVGASVGVSMTVALLARSAQINQSYLSEHFTAFDHARWAAVGGPPGANASTGALVGEIGRQAASIAYANDFYVLAVCTLLTLPMLLALRSSRATAPTQTPAAMADAGH